MRLPVCSSSHVSKLANEQKHNYKHSFIHFIQQKQQQKSQMERSAIRKRQLLGGTVRRVPVPADGNCFFHAVEVCTNGRYGDHRELRRRLWQEFQTRQEDLSRGIEIDEHGFYFLRVRGPSGFRTLGLDREWIRGTTEVRVMADIIHTCIEVLNYEHIERNPTTGEPEPQLLVFGNPSWPARITLYRNAAGTHYDASKVIVDEAEDERFARALQASLNQAEQPEHLVAEPAYDASEAIVDEAEDERFARALQASLNQAEQPEHLVAEPDFRSQNTAWADAQGAAWAIEQVDLRAELDRNTQAAREREQRSRRDALLARDLDRREALYQASRRQNNRHIEPLFSPQQQPRRGLFDDSLEQKARGLFGHAHRRPRRSGLFSAVY
jgi:hypothetical protein